MTIEEWLDKRIEDTEKNCREKHLDSYDNGYWDGYYDALDDLLRELPLFEHEVTLREVSELCGDCIVIARTPSALLTLPAVILMMYPVNGPYTKSRRE